MFAFPPLLLAIVIVAAFGAGFWTSTIAIAIIYIPLLARVVRGVVLVEREKAYVDACKVQGFSGFRVSVRHVLPNVSPTIVAQSTLNFGYALLDLAGLAFLGLGVQPPTSDWGQMLTDGRESLILHSYSEVISASVAIAVTVVVLQPRRRLRSREQGGERRGDARLCSSCGRSRPSSTSRARHWPVVRRRQPHDRTGARWSGSSASPGAASR